MPRDLSWRPLRLGRRASRSSQRTGAAPSRPLLVATFLAMLELARLTALLIYQGLNEEGAPEGAIRLRDETALDPYVFQREGFLQRRRALIFVPMAIGAGVLAAVVANRNVPQQAPIPEAERRLIVIDAPQVVLTSSSLRRRRIRSRAWAPAPGIAPAGITSGSTTTSQAGMP